VEQREAIALIGAAVGEKGRVWADLGAGSGVFTRALASLLGPAGTVYAVDRNAAALRELTRTGDRTAGGAAIRTVVGDFAEALELPPLDGVLVANALHYVPYAEQAAVMRRVASMLTDGAPIVVVEYDRRHANQWVPYPTTPAALATAARDAGLDVPTVLATRPSQYGGTIYSAVVRRPASAGERIAHHP
jgi:ubiquinone/menaquinone biosynthesis C-methylase UbiE